LKQIRRHLTYSNVMSSLAVFLILGGATAFAAIKKVGANEIKANSIKTGKIVKEAVTSGKLKNGAVTESKIADGAVTTNKIANDAVTGAKVNEGTLGQVPSAATAGSVGGNTVRRVFFKTGPNQGDTTILALNGLTLTAKCTANALSGNATTSAPNSMIHSSGLVGVTPFSSEIDNFNVGENFDFLVTGTTGSDSMQGTLNYSQSTGNNVTFVFKAEELAFGQTGCVIVGYAFG
jgi:hypothetical protein